jgi:glycyl-tRNA synthetase beta chain
MRDVINAPNPDSIHKNTSTIKNDFLTFLADRLHVILREEGISHDRINAVFATGEDDLVRITARAKALRRFLMSDDGANLLTAYRRAANILAIEEKKDQAAYRAADVEEALLSEPEEKALFDALKQIGRETAPLLAQEQFVEAMEKLSALRAPVDRFFDKILVNAPDPALRANRLRLLSAIRERMDAIADFTKIEGTA